MKPISWKILFGALIPAALAVCALSRPPQSSTPEIMRQKLDHAQELLQAIVLGELDAAEEHANELHRLAELQSWFVLATPEYAEHSTEFREAVRAVAEAAKRRNVDECTEAYASTVRKCVACHEYMRQVRSAGGRSSPP